MAAHEETTTGNTRFRGCRERRESPTRPGQFVSRSELADLVNSALKQLYPDTDLSRVLVDDRWIGSVERGESRWPHPRRRAALRHVLDADTDQQLGLYNPRRTGTLAATDGENPGQATRGQAPPQGEADQAHEASGTDTGGVGSGLDPTVVHPARRYNYWLGGKDHFAADRNSGDLIEQAFPTVVKAAVQNRAFLQRAVTHLARAGITQFLDIGCGLPVPGNTHDIAQCITPQARVLYVDNDPLVMAHARALLHGDPRGRTGYLEADLRDPAALLHRPELPAVLDLHQPVAVLLVAVLHFIHDHQEAVGIVRHLVDALPAGSLLVISNATMDFNTPAETAKYEDMFAAGQTDARARTKSQISDFFTGLDLLPPGVVAVTEWQPDQPTPPLPAPHEVAIYGAVGRLR